MAATAAARVLTEAFRLTQLRLRATSVGHVVALWGRLTPGQLESAWPSMERALAALVADGRQGSSTTAMRYVEAFRTAEGVAGAAPSRLAPPVAGDLLSTSFQVTGLYTVRHLLALKVAPEKAMATGLVRVSGAVARHVLDGGRGTVDRMVAADPRAKGWARVTSGTACHFCAMLASRGPVYKSARTADGRAYHDHCSCTSEPVYRDDAAWPGKGQEYAKLWQESTAGLSGTDAINAFRRALSGGATP